MKQETSIRNKKGAAAVEFALILPILVVLTFGIIEFGLVLYDQAVITNASREGARTGVLYQQPAMSTAALQSEVATTVNDYCGNYLVSLGAKTASPTVDVTGDCQAPGNDITVSVTYPYTFLVMQNLVQGMTGIANVGAVTTMRCEGY